MSIKTIPYTDDMTGESIARMAPCIISDMPNDVYHSTVAISKSGLDKIRRSPAHYRYGEHKQTKAMEIGSALHEAVLEPAVFESDYLMLPDVKDRRASEYKQAVKSLPESCVLVGNECVQIDNMVKAIKDNATAEKIMGGDGYRELAFFAKDPETGVLCKAKLDFLGFDGKEFYAVDLKSTSDAAPDAFIKSIAQYRYYVQAAFYSDVFRWATGLELHRFWFAAVEKEVPNGVLCRWMDDEAIEIGRAEYREDLDLYAQCVRDDYWPCYEQPASPEECSIGLPYWKVSQHESALIDELE